MLGRTAASLFWMSRYMERAENVSRLIGVGYRESLTPDIGVGYRDDWTATLTAAGCLADYKAKHAKVTAESVQKFLLLDRDNPSSIRSCIETARNNGRSVRTALTREMWEALNATYNDFNAINPSDLGPARLLEVLDWTRERANLFRGAMLGSLLRDEGYCFSQLGTFVERGDNTARNVATKYSVLLPVNEVAGGERNLHQLETILRMVAAHQSYRYFFKYAYRAPQIVDFIVLRPEMPRSLRFCSDWVVSMLTRLTELTGVGAGSLAAAKEIQAGLMASTPDSISQEGLHGYLTDFLSRNAALAARTAADFNFG